MKTMKNIKLDLDMEPISKRTVWTFRIIVLVLFVMWLSCVLYLRGQIRQEKAKLERARIEDSRRQEFLRRGAQYKQDLQQRNQPSKARNVFDGR